MWNSGGSSRSFFCFLHFPQRPFLFSKKKLIDEAYWNFERFELVMCPYSRTTISVFLFGVQTVLCLCHCEAMYHGWQISKSSLCSWNRVSYIFVCRLRHSGANIGYIKIRFDRTSLLVFDLIWNNTFLWMMSNWRIVLSVASKCIECICPRNVLSRCTVCTVCHYIS